MFKVVQAWAVINEVEFQRRSVKTEFNSILLSLLVK